jgi:hypothetical protein
MTCPICGLRRAWINKHIDRVGLFPDGNQKGTRGILDSDAVAFFGLEFAIDQKLIIFVRDLVIAVLPGPADGLDDKRLSTNGD